MFPNELCRLLNLYPTAIRCNLQIEVDTVLPHIMLNEWMNQSNVMYDLMTSKTQLEIFTYVCYINTTITLTHTHTLPHTHVLLLKRKEYISAPCPVVFFILILNNDTYNKLCLTFFPVFISLYRNSVRHTNTHTRLDICKCQFFYLKKNNILKEKVNKLFITRTKYDC